jgi:Protein tyrosine phosphatase-like protein, PTPLA
VLVFLCIFYGNNLLSLLDPSDSARVGRTLCNDQFVPIVRSALMISFLELFNSITGMTRSKPAQVLLFAIIRFGVEHIVGSSISTCPSAWSHVVTVVCWSLGDSIRFGCFFLDSVASNGSRWAKYVRYTVGPILFPLGTLGEMFMVLTMAVDTYRINKLQSIAMYIAALVLWPIGFYSLFTQLLRQRQKFLQQLEATSDERKKAI